MIYALADTHLSFAQAKPMTKFGTIWQDHPLKLARNWQTQIQQSDLVIIAGDISWATYLESAVPDLAYLAALPGQKLITRGNHDYWWASRNKFKALMRQQAWSNLDFLHNSARLWYDKQLYEIADLTETVVADLTKKWLEQKSQIASSKIAISELGTTTLNSAAVALNPNTATLKSTAFTSLPSESAATTLKPTHKPSLIIGHKGYLTQAELKDANQARLFAREYERLLLSYRQGEEILALLHLEKSDVNLICVSHYPPFLKQGSKQPYFTLHQNWAKEFAKVDVIYGHLHGLGIKTAYLQDSANLHYHLCSLDALKMQAKLITPEI